ncbi:hypothetical protein CMO91_04675 [Candidatus Woesearchaeota archaeon]|jgi:hypothetical protein|nr:hypothetical protein [Candidatus Woesearchaeota archaeon]|tara:strand:+ start:427 stop:861 length:435 start_codon:yes stop_codon:yes gene_type:complete
MSKAVLALLVLAACASVDLPADLPEVTLYKGAQCGCCEGYGSYLEQQGFTVNVKDMADLSPIKKQYGIPGNMQSCHTTIMGDYFVEGHVPIEAIAKLLNEKPDIAGIMLPNMPSASPGMPGRKTEVWIISSLDKNGIVKEFMQI